MTIGTDLLTNPLVILQMVIDLGILLTSILLTIFTWVTFRKVGLLNKTLTTSVAKVFSFTALLFFLLSVGTLFIFISRWIRVFS